MTFIRNAVVDVNYETKLLLVVVTRLDGTLREPVSKISVSLMCAISERTEREFRPPDDYWQTCVQRAGEVLLDHRHDQRGIKKNCRKSIKARTTGENARQTNLKPSRLEKKLIARRVTRSVLHTGTGDVNKKSYIRL